MVSIGEKIEFSQYLYITVYKINEERVFHLLVSALQKWKPLNKTIPLQGIQTYSRQLYPGVNCSFFVFFFFFWGGGGADVYSVSLNVLML